MGRWEVHGRCGLMAFFFACFAFGKLTGCPDEDPSLVRWSPGHDPSRKIVIGWGEHFLLAESATLHSITVTNGGRLVFADIAAVPLVLRVRSILVDRGGQVHAGSEMCPFSSNLSIILYGRSDEAGEARDPVFGRKFIGVGDGGTLEIHGAPKVSWTFLNHTLHPRKIGGGQKPLWTTVKPYKFTRSWGFRGIIVHLIDPATGSILGVDRFDTYQTYSESVRMASHLSNLPAGSLVAIAINDEGSRSLEEAGLVALTQLGATAVRSLGFRHAWAMIATVGDVGSAVEAHSYYQGKHIPINASVSRLVRIHHSGYYTVSTVSEWRHTGAEQGGDMWTKWIPWTPPHYGTLALKFLELHHRHPGHVCRQPSSVQVRPQAGWQFDVRGEMLYKKGRPFGVSCYQLQSASQLGCPPVYLRFLCPSTVRPSMQVEVLAVTEDTIVEVADDVTSWKSGDIIVVASTDFSMKQAEEFTLLPCRACSPYQLKIQGIPRFLHMGEKTDGVDMRAEVGLLTRNILITADMETSCYGNNSCEFFSEDTFGGHIRVEQGFRSMHLEGAELRYLGQQLIGHYPVHFHLVGDVDDQGGYSPPTYIRSLSIHHSFSRCVTLHGTNGLLVQDVVGYNTHGHCFFTEDGPEERNTFWHCLGLLVHSGPLLPSDRDTHMCRILAARAFPGSVARSRRDCSGVSAFWISNPNNNIIRCSAAGSEEVGFWFIFHHQATGLSKGSYPPGYTERLPLGTFLQNRAHSNHRAGLILDHGVKVSEPNERDRRPALSIISGRYSPHIGADRLKPRIPARIQSFTAFKNEGHGAWLRGGDIRLHDCQFADNGVGLTLASGGTFPDDDGATQEVRDSLFVGESGNLGTPGDGNVPWGPGGTDHQNRTLPHSTIYPLRGFQIYDGPIKVENVTFSRFAALKDRHVSAIAFRLNNNWQSCPCNNLSAVSFQGVPPQNRVFFGEPGPWFRRVDEDGDKTAIFHDEDGSVTSFPGSFVLRHDNYLLRHPDCVDVPDWRATVCSGSYAQLYLQARNPSWLRLKMVRDDYPTQVVTLKGALRRGRHYQQYQPVVMLSRSYTLHWDGPAPSELTIWPVNFNKNDWVRLGICYPRGTLFSVIWDIHSKQQKTTRKLDSFVRVSSLEKLTVSGSHRPRYYWDEWTGLLFLHVRTSFARNGHEFCSVRGCERVRIKADIPPHSGPSDCSVLAYPKYSTSPSPVAMPPRLVRHKHEFSNMLVEVKLQSLISREKSAAFAAATVDGRMVTQPQDGLQLLTLDAHSGHLTGRSLIPASSLFRFPFHLDSFLARAVRNNSVLILTSRGQLPLDQLVTPELLHWLRIPMTQVRANEQLVLVGFRGTVWPAWTCLDAGRYAAQLNLLIALPPRPD
uniref:cell migration-inducing and hyaluronan-binding protein isoform X2 n=1 Tax=Myxine glutinosa TaxID=7769 RepID=UPI00358FC834